MIQLPKRFALLLGVVITCSLSFWLGKRQSSKDAFERGSKLERERAARFRAADSHLYVSLFDSGRTDELRDYIVNGMWISIVRMDNNLHNPDASSDDKEATANVLPKLIEYFYTNPKTIHAPQKSRIASDVNKELKIEEKSPGAGAEKEILGALYDASKEPLGQLDGLIDAVLTETQKLDLETQEVLMRHIKQRNFPGRERSVAGVSLMMPRDTGGGRGKDDFHWTGKKIRMSLEKGKLEVNDRDYGSVSKGDTVDLRLLGHVFVNDAERQPFTEAEPAAPSDGDTPPK